MLRRPSSRIAGAVYVPAGGFTLIEVMIAVVVVSILAAIAVPQYTEFVMRSRITDATATMDDIRIRMEQYFQDNRRYDNAGACGIGPNFSTANFQFACAPVGAPAQSYGVTATGLASMSAFVYTLTVTPAGVTRATTGTHWGATSATCWVVRKNGKCS